MHGINAGIGRVLALTVAAVMLVACGGDDAVTTVTVSEAPAGESSGGDTGSSAPAGTSPADLADGQELDIAIGEPGSVRIRRSGNDIELVSVQLASGWTQRRETEILDNGVDLVFTRGLERIEFSAEIDNGLLEVDIDRDND